MHFFAWLFGRSERPAVAPASPQREPVAAVAEPKPAATSLAEPKPPAPPAEAPPAPRVVLPPSEADNVARWKASGQARAWVEARRGTWDHDDWLRLLGELQASPFWPMQPDAIGAVLEEHKREWLARN